MTNRFALRCALAVALVGLPASLAAQVPEVSTDNTPFGATSGEFLLLGAGARGTALGNAYSSLSMDVSALYYNPAGIALMSRPQAMVGSYDYVADTRYTWGGAAFPFGGGSKAFGVQMGNIKDTQATPKVVYALSGNMVRAGWNYFLIEGDQSLGLHNPTFANAVLSTTLSKDLSQ